MESASSESGPTYIDVFAGCGGLSLGLEWAGFHRIAAIESSQEAARTYFHNLICREEVAPLDWPSFLNSREAQVSTGLIVGSIEERFTDFLNSCKKRAKSPPDLVAGGPPCQGFSTAGLRDPSDPRNQLANFMVTSVEMLCPKAVLVENVPAMRSSFGREGSAAPALEDLVSKLKSLGYMVSTSRLDATLFGVPQKRSRLFVLAIREDIFDALPTGHQMAWRERNGLLSLMSEWNNTPTVREALADLGQQGYRIPSRQGYEGLPFARTMRFDRRLLVPAASAIHERPGSGVVHNHELRAHRDATVERFRLLFRLRELRLKPRMLQQAAFDGKDRLLEILRGELRRNGYWQHGSELLLIELAEQIFEHRSKKHSQTVLVENAPAATVTTLPDDMVHYEEPRVPTVRELARLQSFPDSFVFKGRVTTGGPAHKRRHEVPQYTQVGNAVPPLVARGVGQLLRKLIRGPSLRTAPTPPRRKGTQGRQTRARRTPEGGCHDPIL